MHTGQRFQFPLTIEERLAPPSPEPAPDARPAPSPREEAGERAVSTRSAAAPEQDAPAAPAAEASPVDVLPILRSVADGIRALGEQVAKLSDEVERLRTISSVRSSSTSAIERRLGRLEQLIEAAFPPEAESAAESAVQQAGAEADERPPGLLEVVQDAAEMWSDALIFLDEAYTSASDSPYEDPERVRAILEAMAQVARRRRDGSLGTTLRESFADFGIDYRPSIARSTSARLRRQYHFTYRGATIEAEEHIALGGTYDPRRCLRIYFTSRLPHEPRFVIAHVGRHFEVMTTT